MKKKKDENQKIKPVQPDAETKIHVEKESEISEPNDGKPAYAEWGKNRPISENDQQVEKKLETDFSELDSLLENYADEPEIKKPRKPRTTKNKEPEKPSMVIPGKLFCLVNDRVITGLISAIDSWVSKEPIDATMLQLQPEQIEDLAPLAEEAVKAMNLQDNPVAMFYGTLGAIYISNYMTLKALILKSKKTAENNKDDNY